MNTRYDKAKHYFINILWKSKFDLNPCLLNSGRREKIMLNFYFHTSLWWLKRFYEGLRGWNNIQYSSTSIVFGWIFHSSLRSVETTYNMVVHLLCSVGSFILLLLKHVFKIKIFHLSVWKLWQLELFCITLKWHKRLPNFKAIYFGSPLELTENHYFFKLL